MNTSLVVTLAVIASTLATATVIGVLVNRRSGHLRAVSTKNSGENTDTADLGLSRTGPTVVHFSAEWCGPCKAVRRVVDQVCDDLPGVAHVEIDLDVNPAAARRHAVLSLPTTLIFDAGGRQQYRTTGVPKANELRAAIKLLLA